MMRRLLAALQARGATRVGFDAFVLIQLLHLGEHVAQIVQLRVLEWPASQARGLISPLDVEKVHFGWNVAVLVGLVWLLRRSVRSRWLLATMAWAALHTAEHAYLLARALRSGLEGEPGILGAHGALAAAGVSIPGLTTWSRPAVHLAWNVGEVTLLGLAYFAFARSRVPVPRVSRLAWAAGVALMLVTTPDRAAVQSPATRWVNGSDPTCDGRAPCYPTIQAAIDAVHPGETIVVQPGRYAERLWIRDKHMARKAAESERIIVTADPQAAVGSVLLTGAGGTCDDGAAIRVQRSRFVTVRGFTITGFAGPAVKLLGGRNANVAIHLERLRVFANGGDRCDGGISIGPGNSATLVAQNLVHGNRGAGIFIVGGEASQHIVNNTVHGNAGGGIVVERSGGVVVVNNAVTANGRYGVELAATGARRRGGIQLLHNLVCGNAAGEVDGVAWAETMFGNLTPTGAEASGIAASPGCEIAAHVYTDVRGADARADTGDEEFMPAAASPLIDRGMDPRRLGLGAALDPIFEADFVRAARPRPGRVHGPALFDIGALEFVLADTGPPEVVFLEPGAGAFLHGVVAVVARAADDAAVAGLAVNVEGRPLAATARPAPPAPVVTADARLDTTTLDDGAHTLTATAVDDAGNRATASRIIVVDNTPPDTAITSGPAGDIADTRTTFTFGGTDNLTPPADLSFAWRIDDRPFTAFSRATTAALEGLAEGVHVFEVKARDAAGNEDPVPVRRSFRVALAPAITEVRPAAGPVGTLVTLTGTRFAAAPTRVAFGGVPASIRSLTDTSITTSVPFGAESGVVTVTTANGTSGAAFTITRSADFALTVAPAEGTTLPGGSVSYAVTAAAVDGFTGLVSVSVSAMPAGVTAAVTPDTLAPGQTGTLTVRTDARMTPGLQTITVTAAATIDAASVVRRRTITLRVLPSGTTALAGRVLDTDGNPVAGVNLALAGAATRTDAGGNFLFVDVPAGSDQFLFIDGSTAVPDRRFPSFPVLVTLQAGALNRLPFTPYLHAQKAFNFTTIVPGQETVVVDPDIPGFEMRIPADVRIIGWDGQPNTRVSVRTVPLDRMPLPHPDPPIAARSVYMLYFDKIGGGTPTRPIPVTAPNDLELEPGAAAELWYYDEGPTPGSATQRWQKAGTATVSADGKTITTDPGVGLPRFCCGAFCFASVTRPALGVSLKRGGARGGEPVDLATGLFVLEHADLTIRGRLPLALGRVYRNADPTLGPFGVGSSAFFTETLLQPTPQSLVLVEPGNTRTTFARQTDGTFTNETVPELRGARGSVNADGTATLRFRDGAVHAFEPAGGGTFQLRSIADRSGNAITIERDGAGRPTGLIEPGGRRIELTFNVPFAQVIAARDSAGRDVHYTYDGGFRLTSVTDPSGGVTRYTYDASGNLASIVDARGVTTLVNEYSASGRVVKQTQADGGVWLFAYMVAGARVSGPGCPGPSCPEVESRAAIERGYTFGGGFVVATMVTDPEGHVTTSRFNNFGELVERIDALGQSTVFERADGTNLLRSTTDPLGRRTRYEYDAAGNVVAIVDSAGNTRSFAYEPRFNRMTAMTDELGHTTRFDYDGAGNLVAVVDPLGHRTSLAYDGTGRLVAVADAVSNTHRFTYDPLGNLTAVADPLGHVTRREFDAVGRLAARIDARGARTTFRYDPLDRLVAITDAAGGASRFSYDPAGALQRVVDPAGGTTAHAYDALNRLTVRTDAAGRSETFTYDARGNVLTATHRNGRTTRYAYDPLSRLASVQYADGSRVDLAYDAGGRVVSLIDSLSGPITRRYDDLDRLVAETTAHGTVTYRYDAAGRPLEMTAPGQPSVTYHWDAGGRLTALAQGGHVVTLEYDAAGRRTRLALSNGVATEYEYDAASRVTGLRYRAAQSALGEILTDYDAVGRRVGRGGAFARTLLDDAVTRASYAAANRQVVFGAAAMTYDDNGNVTSIADAAGTTTLTWDARDRLIAVDAPTSAQSFAYDALGRRIRRVVDGTVIDYVYDGVDVIQELRDAHAVTYLRAPWPDEPFVRSSGEVYLTDSTGSVIALTDDQGTVTTSYTYGVFGGVLASGGATANPYRYAGRPDDDNGLSEHRHRYYAPRLRRFVSEEPIGFAGGDPNLYAYVSNNPVNLVDGSGRDATIWAPPGPGRTWKDGPRNGNWGGARWSGGQGPPFSGTMLPPVDSGDECYMRHDLCWEHCAKCPATESRCKIPCNRSLVHCLESLADDPRQWPRPPRPGTENDSRFFRRMAIESFRTPREDVFPQIHPLIP